MAWLSFIDIERDNWREHVVLWVWYLMLCMITARLFYWQVLEADSLQATATTQYEQTQRLDAQRGEIRTSDGYTLVTNALRFRLFAEPHRIDDPAGVARQLAPVLQPEAVGDEELRLRDLLESERSWTALASDLTSEDRTELEELQIHGIGFDRYYIRSYPEASIAAHVTGFVGKDRSGHDTGYFGIEGALDQELSPQSGKLRQWADALGLGLFSNTPTVVTPAIAGRTITTTIQRDVQALIDQELKRGLEIYGAERGEIVVMDPRTGAILGLAAQPSYDPAQFYKFDNSLHKNPTLAELFEPGSTFKVLTVASGLEHGVITPQTPCAICEGPYVVDEYTIRTWDNTYREGISMREGLARSDNTAMIDIANRLGRDNLRSSLQDFGIGEPLSLDLQEDTTTPFPEKWGPVELATRSFGQGVVTNSLQMTRAVSAIANDGIMMQPSIVASVTDPATGEELITEPTQLRRVISSDAAEQTTEMMVYAASQGEAQWTASDTYTVAGKTGTSQIPDPEGGYKEDETIASFVGFAPAEQPRFVMLVKLDKPGSSPWAAETAAPLWYDIADKLRLLVE